MILPLAYEVLIAFASSRNRTDREMASHVQGQPQSLKNARLNHTKHHALPLNAKTSKNSNRLPLDTPTVLMIPGVSWIHRRLVDMISLSTARDSTSHSSIMLDIISLMY